MKEEDIGALVHYFPIVVELGLTLIGEQIKCPAGVIDSLWKDNDDNYVVVEYKRWIANDSAVGQILRYMGWVKIKYNVSYVRGILYCKNAIKNIHFAVNLVSESLVCDLTIKKFDVTLLTNEMISIKIPLEYHRKLQQFKAKFLAKGITLSYIEILVEVIDSIDWDQIEAKLLKVKTEEE